MSYCQQCADLLRERDTLLAEVERLNGKWLCFHCGETFDTPESAQEHFGKSLCCETACAIDIAEYRRMEECCRSHHEEDTELHREIARLHSAHVSALRTEEEKGYARGLNEHRLLLNENESLRATVADQAAALAERDKDAERYRWLRHGDNDDEVIRYTSRHTANAYVLREDKLDIAIDAALAASVSNASEDKP